MQFSAVDLTSTEALKLRMIKVRIALRAYGFGTNYGVINLFKEAFPEYASDEYYHRLRNVYSTVATDEDITAKFEQLVERIPSMLDGDE